MPPGALSVLLSVCLHIALATVDRTPKPVLTPVRCCHPEAFDPGRLMSHMLGVTALQVNYPIPLVVLVQGNDQALHPATSAVEVLDLRIERNDIIIIIIDAYAIISHVIHTMLVAFA
jgi:hypothetical protein